MRGLDTNVLLRAILQDDPKHSPIAAQVIVDAQQQGERLYVSLTVLCELLWTLRSKPYRFNRQALSGVVENLLANALFAVQDQDLVERALSDYRQGRADFSDYLLGWQSWKAGCSHTLTFDRKMRTQEGFRVLSL